MSQHSEERAIMRGRLEELKQKRERCRYAIKGNADAIRGKLNTLLNSPDDLEVPLIDELWDQIKSSWSELQLHNADIRKFEKELA